MKPNPGSSIYLARWLKVCVLGVEMEGRKSLTEIQRSTNKEGITIDPMYTQGIHDPSKKMYAHKFDNLNQTCIIWIMQKKHTA